MQTYQNLVFSWRISLLLTSFSTMDFVRSWLGSARQRAHSQRRLLLGLWIAVIQKVDQHWQTGVRLCECCSVGNRSATLCRMIVDEQLDVLAITETWHERSESTELRRLIPPGYRCTTDAARPLPSNVSTDTLAFRNHGGLAFIYRQAKHSGCRRRISMPFPWRSIFCAVLRLQQAVTSAYRSGSQPPSATFSMICRRFSTRIRQSVVVVESQLVTITYKLATLTFKAKYCRTSLYLHEQLPDHRVARALRSTTAPLFYRLFVSMHLRLLGVLLLCTSCLELSRDIHKICEHNFSSFRRYLKSELFAAAYDT